MIKNSSYNVIGSVLRTGLNLLIIPAIIHLLGIEEYGLLTLVSTVIGIVSLAEAGLTVSTTVFLSQDLANHDSEAISQTLTVTIVIMFLIASLAALALYINAGLLVGFFPTLEQAQRSIAIQSFQIGGVILWARLLQQIPAGIEQAYQQYGVVNILSTFQSIFLNLGMLIIAWKGGQTLPLIQWQALISVIMLLVHTSVSCFFLRHIELRFNLNKEKGLKIVSYSLMTWLTTVGSALFSQGDRLIVGNVLGTKLLGVYAAITSVAMQINILLGTALQPMLPRLSSMGADRASDSFIALRQQIKSAFQANVVVSLGLGCGLLLTAPLIMRFILPVEITKEYLISFYAAIVIYLLYCINTVGYYVLLSFDVVRLAFIVLGSGLLSLLLIFWGATVGGLFGAVLGNIGFFGSFLCTFMAMKNLSVPVKEWIAWIKPRELISFLYAIDLIGLKRRFHRFF
jgi:O-antigen/teichoic acid export membrane protein